MNLRDPTLAGLTGHPPRAASLSGLARTLVRGRLGALREGRLLVREPGGATAFGPGGGIETAVTVRDPAFYAELAFGGSVGKRFFGLLVAEQLALNDRVDKTAHTVPTGLRRVKDFLDLFAVGKPHGGAGGEDGQLPGQVASDRHLVLR